MEKKQLQIKNVYPLYRMRTDVSSRKYKKFLFFLKNIKNPFQETLQGKLLKAFNQETV